MKTDKRLWLYAGLAIPDGFALVSNYKTKIPITGQTILFVGTRNKENELLLPQLNQLITTAGGKLAVDLRPREEWLFGPFLKNNLTTFRPLFTIISIDPIDSQLVLAFDHVYPKITIVPHGTFKTGAIKFPTKPNVITMAATAARILETITNG